MLILPLSLTAEETISVIFSGSTPPYVIQEQDRGIVVDIVSEALALKGYRVEPVYLPIGRGSRMFAERKVDATSIIKTSSGLKDAHYSDHFMQYHNFAFTLKRPGRRVHIESVEELAHLDVIAFQYAHRYLGEAFGEAVRDNPRYREFADQETQARMLLKGRTDVAVMDRSIFEFYMRKLIAAGDVPADVEVARFNLFEPSKYRTAFVDPQLRDAFEAGLAQLRESGRYEAIYRHYTESYFEVPR
ncbi:MAG: substrate-binding periplasmic protein [Pseudomonadota bacterium]